MQKSYDKGKGHLCNKQRRNMNEAPFEFDPRIESHEEFRQNHFELFLEKFKKINQDAAIFNFME